jgi:ParB family chromosome partitioning protein
VTKRGLGKGLSALIPSISPIEGTYVQQIPVESISPNPNQPRKHLDEIAFEELVASIREVGLVQPVVVRPKGSGYELVAGERRWKAAQAAGLTNVPAVVKNTSDSESLEIALIENLQREDLNAIEEANAYLYLTEVFNMTQEEIAKKVGKNRVTVTNTLRLLRLNPEIQKMVVDGQISSGHARPLLAIDDHEQQLKVARKIAEQGLTVRQAESIARLMSSKARKNQKEPQPQAFKDIAERLSQTFSAKVKVKMVGEKGKIEISFPLSQLNKIIEHLLKEGSSTNIQ